MKIKWSGRVIHLSSKDLNVLNIAKFLFSYPSDYLRLEASIHNHLKVEIKGNKWLIITNIVGGFDFILYFQH